MAAVKQHPAGHLSASFSATIRLALENRPGASGIPAGVLSTLDLARLASGREVSAGALTVRG